jgi:antitoxin component HigA of HigAB toxin-antitoxin module
MVISEQEYEAALKEVQILLEADESPENEKRIFELCALIEEYEETILELVEFSRRAMSGSNNQES